MKELAWDRESVRLRRPRVALVRKTTSVLRFTRCPIQRLPLRPCGSEGEGGAKAPLYRRRLINPALFTSRRRKADQTHLCTIYCKALIIMKIIVGVLKDNINKYEHTCHLEWGPVKAAV